MVRIDASQISLTQSTQLLLAPQIADKLNVSTQRVYELVRTNQIPVIRLGERQYRFDIEAIDEWLKQGGVNVKVAEKCEGRNYDN